MRSYRKTLEVFKNGGIVIFPTDTAYGIGCRMDSPRAVRRIYKLRNRPQEKAVLVLVSNRKMAQNYFKPLTPEVKRLISKNWPGPLTVVYPCKTSKVPSVVRGGGVTLGVRMPAHRTIRKLIDELGVPIIAPSANFAGGKTPFEAREIDEKLLEKADFFMNGRCTFRKPSTVVDCSKKPFQVLRKGAVKVAESV